MTDKLKMAVVLAAAAVPVALIEAENWWHKRLRREYERGVSECHRKHYA